MLYTMKKLTKIICLLLTGLFIFSCQVGERGQKPVKKVILMIGDGMGVAQVYAGLTANHGQLNLERCSRIGFVKTYSADHYITDSAAGGTAFSTGKKTKNGMIGMSPDSVPVPTILEIAEHHGLSTGLVSTSAITHATPASFIAHQAARASYEDIAADFLKTDIDVFIGGGWLHFTQRADSMNLTAELKSKGYHVLRGIDSLDRVSSIKLACFTADMHNPSILGGRDDMLQKATVKAIQILNENKKGFFLMIEGSMIDWGCHGNDIAYVVSEMIDFDQAVGKALDFAEKDGQTLVVITADHETGGLALTGGNFETGEVSAAFSSGDHTGIMVPLFAYGPGADMFSGICENTQVFDKIISLLGLDNTK